VSRAGNQQGHSTDSQSNERIHSVGAGREQALGEALVGNFENVGAAAFMPATITAMLEGDCRG
jgi:phosphoribosylamine-glycine ligase